MRRDGRALSDTKDQFVDANRCCARDATTLAFYVTPSDYTFFVTLPSQAQQSNSLFGSTNAPPASSLFSGQSQPQVQQQSNGQQGGPAPSNGNPAAFAGLLEKGKKRGRDAQHLGFELVYRREGRRER